MTLIASLLFAIALASSIGVIALTISNGMPRIAEIVDRQFAPAVHVERQIFFGEVKGRRSAEVIVFPRGGKTIEALSLAA